MDERANSYWSVDTCNWVRSPDRSEVPVPRPAAAPDALIDLSDPSVDSDAYSDVPTGAPV